MRAATAALLLTTVSVAWTGTANADGHVAAPGQQKPGQAAFAVIGDMPYGSTIIAEFPGLVRQINAADPDFTVHVGDIKNGSSRCDDPTYQSVKSVFDTFSRPLIYTPGDNEWTDCHRPSNGAYDPLERLAHDRSVFFADPGTTLGETTMTVDSQAAAGFPENVSWRYHGVDMATLHIVGSNNDLDPWTGLGNTGATPRQVAEEQLRTANAIALVHHTFAQAAKHRDSAVAFFQQADMFDPTYTPAWSDISAFQPLIQALIDESSRFDGTVYLFDGDSHVYNADHPLATGSPWLSTYGVAGAADNLQRITVDGAANADRDWLRVTVNRPRAGEPLSWERVPYTH